MRLGMATAIAFAASCVASTAEDATFTTRQLTPETALKLARATLEACRKEGFQVAVAVTDRAGVAQVVKQHWNGTHDTDPKGTHFVLTCLDVSSRPGGDGRGFAAGAAAFPED
jgi:hypothetical protein